MKTKRKVIRRAGNIVKGITVRDAGYLDTPTPPTPYSGVWSGSIGRLRYYASQQIVHVFLDPGLNDNWIGTTTDPTMIKALFLARDNGRGILGYTGNDVIEFIDY
jgi:hypothetical protein